MLRIGRHRLSNLNILDAGVSGLFNDGRKALILYCDPPFGNMKFWETLAAKDMGRRVDPVSFEALLDRLFVLAARHVSGHVFVETGRRFKDDVMNRMIRLGLKNIAATTLQYGSGETRYENALLFGSFLGADAQLSRLAGLSGGKVAELAIQPLAEPGEIVFDPCCGLGYSARAAVLNGMEFRGNELNSKRLEKTKARLS